MNSTDPNTYSWVPDRYLCSNDSNAEWNFYLDPVAADLVLKSGISLEIYPFQVTANFDLAVTNAISKEFEALKSCTLYGDILKKSIMN